MPRKKREEEPKPKIVWKTADQYLEERKKVEHVSTNTLIDELIGGGIEKGEVLEFYGEYASGKTQICLSLATTVLGEVAYVDCEDTFKPERIAEIARNRGLDPKKVLGKIHLCQVYTVAEQIATLDAVEEKKPEIIIIDGLTTLFREEYIGRETLVTRQGILRTYLHSLKKYARENNVAIVVTNQVFSNPSGSPFLPLEYLELAVGGNTLYHTLDNRIFIRKGAGGKRIAKLVDSSMYPPGERPFIISGKGVEPLLEKKQE